MANSEQLKKQKEYEKYVKRVTPVHSLPLNMIKAFFTGGLICMSGQFLLNTAQSLGADKEEAGSWCSLILILISVILTGLNLYSKIGKFDGAGGLVPITGSLILWQPLPLSFRQRGRSLVSAARSLPLQDL